MGHKTHPIGFRLGIIKGWQARWFAARSSEYRDNVLEDLRIRKAIFRKYPDAGIASVEIERGSVETNVTVNTSRPGIVIGRGGSRVEELRQLVEKLTRNTARLNVAEIRQPELNAFLVAQTVAGQLEKRVVFRRAMRQAMGRTMQSGAQGIRILCSGRLGGREIARSEKAMEGRVPLHTLRADIDFAAVPAHTQMGVVGVKVWIYRGEILPQPEETDEDIRSIEVQVLEETENTEDEHPATPLTELAGLAESPAEEIDPGSGQPLDSEEDNSAPAQES